MNITSRSYEKKHATSSKLFLDFFVTVIRGNYTVCGADKWVKPLGSYIPFIQMYNKLYTFGTNILIFNPYHIMLCNYYLCVGICNINRYKTRMCS